MYMLHVIIYLFLECVNHQKTIHLFHFLTFLKVDGVAEDGTVLQFHGCFHHGCPRCYPDQSVRNPLHGHTMRDLHQRTMRITQGLRAGVHTVLEMWECDFRASIRKNDDALDMQREFLAVNRLEPRDAFFGGRTNAVRLYHECTEPGETIRYVDYTSLYPWACKYGRYPLGHPDIFIGADIPDKVEGLLKCTILPPQNLYHPLLPYRCNGKLMFPLCRSCADGCLSPPCTHSESERALTGTWISAEVEKALTLGYRMVKKIEAWHFPLTDQYNPHTKKGGLWAPYINLWLREKQQVN